MKAVRGTLSAPRLGRYLPAANGDPHLALRLYVWNARLCEAFYLPCQLAEVACRNAVARALVGKYGANWCADSRFHSILPNHLRAELDKVNTEERVRRGIADLTVDHIVAGLTFGFWVALLTAKFDFTIWKGGMLPFFRHYGATATNLATQPLKTGPCDRSIVSTRAGHQPSAISNEMRRLVAVAP
jgi:hypothetical protein